jgi:FAD/FMN-containing dehydrogenase/NADP-dependent 3-hydroxy acid dehydrogenase YdfG
MVLKNKFEKIHNWGLYPEIGGEIFRPASYSEVQQLILSHPEIIARGNGRCYGDASLNNKMISTLALNQIIQLNTNEATITCEAGVILDDILKLVVPKGFFLPVTPGTKFITLGGAMASDIHGKNHHVDGVFSNHVLSFKLCNSKGEIEEVFPGQDLFNRTVGGMGLTGIILEVTFKLKPIQTAYIKQTSIRAKNLQDIFRLFEQNHHFTYSVAWIDCLAKGENLGRSVLLLGEHAKSNEITETPPLKVHKDPKLNIPFKFPSWVLNPLSIKLFNWMFYHKPSSSLKNGIVHYDSFFYPLDKIHNWNRIYGKKGFVQYQFVLPKKTSFQGVKSALEILSKNNLGSFLAVLKLFGKSHEDRYLHFPKEGYTLALDIKIQPKIFSILTELDNLVTEYGGKVYLTKDARMAHDNYITQYKNRFPLEQTFNSHQQIRLHNKKEHVFLILGANSDIAKATAKLYSEKYPEGFLLLASRSIDELKSFVNENKLTQKSSIIYFDTEDFSSHKAFYETLPHKPNWVLYAAGYMTTNDNAIQNNIDWLHCVNVNFTGAVSILNIICNDNNPYLKRIIGMSSIAGLRGRKSNFIYGCTKSGFHQYLFGLRQLMSDRDILVQAITPGFVKTKMTQKLKITKAANHPGEIASLIFNFNNKFEIYPSLFWRLISIVVKNGPYTIIKKI